MGLLVPIDHACGNANAACCGDQNQSVSHHLSKNAKVHLTEHKKGLINLALSCDPVNLN